MVVVVVLPSLPARHGQNPARTQREEHFHLRRDRTAAAPRSFQMFIKGHQTWCTEDQVLIQMLQVILTQLQCHTERLQFLSRLSERFQVPSVAGRYLNPRAAKQLQQRQIGNPDPHHSCAFVLNAFKIRIQRHRIFLRCFAVIRLSQSF